MISRKELFAEISNEAVCEDGEVVGYFVKNSRMNLLEQMLCDTVTVKLPESFKLAKSSSGLRYFYADEVDAALTAAGIKVEAE
ncbi:hypothetical protein QG930_15245 [Klebsiella pneumoniae]|uniref:hypothetical protein n=1 Tax=Klebsiella pneumoniae TaxID=573 RepID=UPI00248CD10F|nr:hypothetical protein [Klebsiella pneumoniae]WGU84782.1 hypothetical protein QG930_15245 [Klebsiella pneumoniae]HDH0745858.1 hypothetical protein [Klebsiella pneumoniae]